MTATDVPQAGQPVDESISIRIDQMRSFRLHPDAGVGMAGIVMQRVNHVLLVFIDQGAIAERGIHSVFSLSGPAVWVGYPDEAAAAA